MENIRRFLAFNTLKCAKCVQNFVVKWHLRSSQQNKRVKWHSFWKFLSQPNLLLMKAPWMSFHYEFLHAAGALEHLWWKKQFFLQFYLNVQFTPSCKCTGLQNHRFRQLCSYWNNFFAGSGELNNKSFHDPNKGNPIREDTKSLRDSNYFHFTFFCDELWRRMICLFSYTLAK